MGKNSKTGRREAPAGSGEERGSWLRAKGPALRFVGISTLFMLVFYGVFYTAPEDSPALHAFIKGYLGAYASAAKTVLELVGFDARVRGTTLILGNRAVEVARGCDAMEPIAFYVAAVIAVHVPWRAKLLGVLAGVPILVLLNLLRIITLAVVSVRFPAQFETAHVTVGQTVFILCTLALWFGWVMRASRGRKAPRAV